MRTLRTIRLLLCLAFGGLLLPLFSQAQDEVPEATRRLIDSLHRALRQGTEDTVRVRILIDLSSDGGWCIGRYDTGLHYARKAVALADKLGYKQGKASALNQIGVIHFIRGSYEEALQSHQAALKLRQETGDRRGVSDSYINLANVYSDQGLYPKALEYYFKSLRIKEELGDQRSMAMLYTNISLVYRSQGNPAEALKNDQAALALTLPLGDTSLLASIYSGLAMNELALKHYAEAETNNALALRHALASENKVVEGNTYTNMGLTALAQHQYEGALTQFRKAAALSEELGDQVGMLDAFNLMGDVFLKTGRAREARSWYARGLDGATRQGNIRISRDAYQGLAYSDSMNGNFTGAFRNLLLFMRYRDSLQNEENTKKSVQLQMQYEFDKKEAAARVEQEKKDARQRNIRNSVVAGLAGTLVFLLVLYRQRNRVQREKKRSDELLLNILPEEVADELKAEGKAEARQFDAVTVLFTDFQGFTQLAEKLSPRELVTEIDTCFRAFDEILERYNVEKIKTIGDAYMAAGGLPVPNGTHAADVVRAALAIRDFMEQHRAEREAKGQHFFRIRIGIHTGPVVAGIVGLKKFAYDIWGDTVNTANRMESSGEAGKINISGATWALVKDEFRCVPRGKVAAKGKGEIEMYFVEG